jgi:hypothetical protein
MSAAGFAVWTSASDADGRYLNDHSGEDTHRCFTAADPFALGLVASLNKPEGNITGTRNSHPHKPTNAAASISGKTGGSWDPGLS